MFYTIYKITNTVNKKTYIGKHQTKNLDDDYYGSGKLLKRAIKKYGKKNFSKEILHVFDNEEEMNSKEKELVEVSDITYNLCEGGKGGWSYVAKERLNGNIPNPMRQEQSVAKRKQTIEDNYTNFYSTIGHKGNKKLAELSSNTIWLDDWKSKHKRGLSKNHQQGSFNSQYGKKFKFVNNGKVNKKIHIDELEQYIQSGFKPGRI